MSDIPAHRRGTPRPLIFHLHAALIARAHMLAPVAPPWPDPFAAQRAALGAIHDPALVQVGMRSLQQMLDGIEAYQRHPARVRHSLPVPIWRCGASRLHDLGGDGPPVLVVPSLINRAYVLDLDPDRSFLRALRAGGVRPFLFDWGLPGPEELHFGLGDYLHERLLPAAQHIGARPNLLGYCMGGALALALAGEVRINRLALIGTPWRFSGLGGVAALARRPEFDLAGLLDGCAQNFGAVPPDLLQTLFAMIAPMQARKFRAFCTLSPAAQRYFVRLEDWLNDPVPLAVPVARQILQGWYGADETGRGLWAPLGRPVDPRRIMAPARVVVGSKDHIAPRAASGLLAASLPRGLLDLRPTGHVGLVAGQGAGRLAADLAAFFTD